MKNRVLWADINTRISDLQFRRMFRLNRQCFAMLCQNIISNIGEEKSKSEAYINEYLKGNGSMYDAHGLTSSGYITGEVKIPVILRLLAGCNALDLAVIFDIYLNIAME